MKNRRLFSAIAIFVIGGALSLFLMKTRPELFGVGILGIALSFGFALMFLIARVNTHPSYYDELPRQPIQDREWMERQGLYHDVREIRRNSRVNL